MVRGALVVCAGIAVFSAAGCHIDAGTFRCSTTAECGTGATCEPSGFCSFDDSTCTSGRRYGKLAPSGVANICTDAVVIDAGIDAAMSDGGAADGGDGGVMVDAGPAACVSEISLGNFHTCIRKGGLIQCFGENDQGQLGNTLRQRSSLPVNVPNIANAVELASGNVHTCARTADAKVYCWGDNSYFQTGRMSQSPSSTPYEVVLAAGAKAITAGS